MQQDVFAHVNLPELQKVLDARTNLLIAGEPLTVENVARAAGFRSTAVPLAIVLQVPGLFEKSGIVNTIPG